MDKPITDDTFIMGYKVGARLCGTLRDAEKAIIQEAGSSWEPLYRRNHVAEETIKRLEEQNAALRDAILEALEAIKLVRDGDVGIDALQPAFVGLVESLDHGRVRDLQWEVRLNNADSDYRAIVRAAIAAAGVSRG